jgi:hypothetical protein
MDGWLAGWYHTLLFRAWDYYKEIVRFRHGIHDRSLDGLEGKFGRGSLGIYSLFVSCLISVFLDQFSWLVWVASAPASCTNSHDRTQHREVRTPHPRTPRFPAFPSIPQHISPLSRLSRHGMGAYFPPLRTSSHYSPESKWQASAISSIIIHLAFLDSGSGPGPGPGFPSHSPLSYFCFCFL